MGPGRGWVVWALLTKIYFRFFEVCTYPRYTFLDSRPPPCNAILEGMPPFSNTSSEAGARPLEVRIENEARVSRFQ